MNLVKNGVERRVYMNLGRTDVKECVFFDFVRNSVRGRAA